MMCSMKAGNPVPDGTYQLDTEGNLVNYGDKWAYGYIVALATGSGLTYYPERHLNSGALAQIAKEQGWPLFGSWVDTETGLQYIDPVVHVSDLDTALSIAQENDQLAIWSLRESAEIRVPQLVGV